MTHRTGIEPVSLNVKFKIAKIAVRHFQRSGVPETKCGEHSLGESSSRTKDFSLLGEQSSRTGTRTRVSWVKAKYPNRLDYTG